MTIARSPPNSRSRSIRITVAPVIAANAIYRTFAKKSWPNVSAVLQAIRVPDDILVQLEESLLSDKTHEETLRKRQAERIEQRPTPLRRRLEQAYVDRLDRKITEEFWEAKSAE